MMPSKPGAGVLLLPVLALLIPLVSGCTGDPDSEVVSGPIAQRMDAYLTALAGSGFSGAVIVRSRDGVMLRKGYGLAEDSTQTPYTTTTVATVGSITKQFTAAAILRLETDGLLSVEDSLGMYFSDVPDEKRSITLHQLLSHTAGFPAAIGDDFEFVDRDAFARLAMGADLEYPPGQGYDYSNVGYSLLAAVVEIVSGRTYEEFLHERLFMPAGLRDTGYSIPDRSGRFMAVGYRDGTRWGRFDERGSRVSWHLLGNGGIQSIPDDMMRWDVALRDGSVLPTDQVEKMYGRYGPDSPAENAWYGYGWMIWPTDRGTRLIKHNGGNGVFYADFLRFVDDDAAIFLQTNRASRAAPRLGWTLADLLFDPTAELPDPVWTAPDLEDFPDSPQGAAVRALVSLLTTGQASDIQPFIESHFAPGFLQMVPMTEHLRILGIIQEELSGRSVTRIRGDGHSFSMELSSDGGATSSTLSVEIGGPAPDLITGLGVN